MGAKGAQVKGHAKEAAGILTGDKDIEAKGKAERRAGEVEEQRAALTGRVEGWLDQAQDAVDSLFARAKNVVRRM